MTIRPPIPLVRQPDGSFKASPNAQIEERMNPEIILPSRTVLTAKAAGYFVATLLAGLGVLVGMLIVCGFAGLFWGIGKMRRAWK